jgi:hypothetical protein
MSGQIYAIQLLNVDENEEEANKSKQLMIPL